MTRQQSQNQETERKRSNQNERAQQAWNLGSSNKQAVQGQRNTNVQQHRAAGQRTAEQDQTRHNTQHNMTGLDLNPIRESREIIRNSTMLFKTNMLSQ